MPGFVAARRGGCEEVAVSSFNSGKGNLELSEENVKPWRMAKKACRLQDHVGGMNEHLWLSVLEKLPDRGDRQAWRLVCKLFRDLEASVRTGLQLLTADMMGSVLERYTALEQLDLSSCSQVTDESLGVVAKHAGPRLRSLKLAKVGGFTEVGLEAIARGCRSLVVLDLTKCGHLTDAGVTALAKLPKLSSLNMLGCRLVTDDGLCALAAGCKGLKVLLLKLCMGVSDIGTTAVAASCRQLHTLDLSCTEISNVSLKQISTLQELVTLSLVGCNNVDDLGLSLLRDGCKSLKKLDISRCPMLTKWGVISFADGTKSLQQLTLSYFLQASTELLASFERMSGLQAINLEGCHVTEAGLALIGRGCKGLKELSLSKCKGVTDEGIQGVVSSCRGLQKLDLTCCRNITDLALSAISTCCKGLLSLKLEYCSLVTDKGISLLGQGCPLLEELDLTDTFINDSGIMSVAKCKYLRLLKVGICVNITDLGISQPCGRCWSTIIEIDLYRSTGVGDVGVEAIATRCPMLRVANLSYCIRITDASMASLGKLHNLQQLELRGCRKVSSAGLASLAGGCKQLKELDMKHCSGLDDSGIFSLVTGCTQLRQINISYCCNIKNAGLLALANLNCMLDLKIVHLKGVTEDCYEKILLACRTTKKVKLLLYLQAIIPADVITFTERRGCRLRWMDKPMMPSFFQQPSLEI